MFFKKYIKCIGYSREEKILKKKVQARTNGKGGSHGIMRCIYAKAQIALKRPYKRTLQVL